MAHSAVTAHYEKIATVYNRTMAEDFTYRFFPVLQRLLLEKLPPSSRVLDVCCGTGQMAREITRTGFPVTGVDGSFAMIKLARENAPSAEFACGDVCDGEIFSRMPKRFDAAISTFNSLAHIDSRRHLARVFRSIASVLRPGGRLLFDLCTEAAYERRWQGCFTLLEDDVACIVRPSWDALAATGRNHVSLFYPVVAPPGSGLWGRSDFCIEQKCYDCDEIQAALQENGFDHIQTFDSERHLGLQGESGRVVFLARAQA